MRENIIKKMLFAYYCIAAILWTYLIVTSLWFSYEHLIGEVPAGMPWIFGVIGCVFALRFFNKKMTRFNTRVNNFLLISNKDIISALIIVLVAVTIFAVLAYGWIKLYPVLF